MFLIQRIAAVAVLLSMLPLLNAQASTTTQTSTAAKAQASAANAGDKLDINTATADQLKSFNGIGDAYAKRIIDGRPYTMKTQLVSKGVLPQATYNKIKDNIVASHMKK